jgi:hypothetical protein
MSGKIQGRATKASGFLKHIPQNFAEHQNAPAIAGNVMAIL